MVSTRSDEAIINKPTATPAVFIVPNFLTAAPIPIKAPTSTLIATAIPSIPFPRSAIFMVPNILIDFAIISTAEDRTSSPNDKAIILTFPKPFTVALIARKAPSNASIAVAIPSMPLLKSAIFISPSI